MILPEILSNESNVSIKKALMHAGNDQDELITFSAEN